MNDDQKKLFEIWWPNDGQRVEADDDGAVEMVIIHRLDLLQPGEQLTIRRIR